MKQRRNLKAEASKKRKPSKVRKGYKSPAEQRAALLKIDNNKVVGRPSKYPNVSKKLVYQLYLLGLTDEEVAPILNVSRETIIGWKGEYPEFLNTIKQAKEIADAQIVNALRQRALGCKIKATKIFYNSQEDKVHTHEYFEHYPPSETAGMFLLRNRQRKLFTEKPEDDGNVLPTTVQVQVVTNDEAYKKLLADRKRKEDDTKSK